MTGAITNPWLLILPKILPGIHVVKGWKACIQGQMF